MMNVLLITAVVIMYLYLAFKVACWVEEYSWFKIILLTVTFLLAFGMYKNNKLPEFVEPFAEKAFFWVDVDTSTVEKAEQIEADKKVPSYKKKITLINKDGFLGIRWKAIIAFAVLVFCASRALDIDWYLPAIIAAVIVLSSALYRNNLLPNFMEPVAKRLFTWTYNLDIDEPYRPAYNRGTCYDLSGTPYVLSIFIDDDESSWSVEEAEDFQRIAVLPDLAFLSEEAARWGVSLEFRSGMIISDSSQNISVRYDGTILTLMDGEGYTSKEEILEQVINSMGFSSADEFYQYLQDITEAEQVAILLLVNKDGRSHAGVDTFDDNGDDVECTTIFSSLMGYKTVSVNHELLHLFGAEDLYEEKETGERTARAAIAKMHYPNDIMLVGSKSIGAYTAYAVGWTDVCPEECMAPEFWEGHWSRE